MAHNLDGSTNYSQAALVSAWNLFSGMVNTTPIAVTGVVVQVQTEVVLFVSTVL